MAGAPAVTGALAKPPASGILCSMRMRFALVLLLGMLVFVLTGPNEAQAQTPPTFQAAGGEVSGTGSVAPAWPAHLVNDVALLFIESRGNEPATLSTPAGFAAVLNSPQAIGGASAGGTTITVFWARATSTAMASPVVADPGNHVYARILTYRNVAASGDPWDVTVGGTKTPASTTVTVTGVTTTESNTLIVQAVARGNDSAAAAFSAQTNANLTSITERSDAGTTDGSGGGFAVWDGGWATAGATGDTTATIAVSVRNAFLTIALRPGSGSIALGDGADPGNAAIGPGGAATMADAFTFATASGTNVVSAVVVGLAAGTSGGLSLVEITNDAGSTVYGSVVNPATDTPSITLSTNTLTATTTTTQYKIRVTPRSHANMPVPPGSAYSVTAKINSWTSTYTQSGSDTAGTTVTIDNLSPANATASSCTAGTEQVTLSWTNPADGDFNSVVVLRDTAAVADTPVEGTTYVVGNTIGASTVACATGSSPCTDTGLTGGTAYHYRLFAKDSNGNYSATGVVPSGSPCTPASPAVPRFNACDVGTTCTNTTPSTQLYTKLAGVAFNLDLVALNTNGSRNTSYNNTVSVELLDSSDNSALPDSDGCRSTWSTIVTLSPNPSFSPADNGLITVGPFTVANAYRDARVRVTNVGGASRRGCSTDNYSIRPSQFVNVLVRDGSRTTAGTTNTLNNTSNPGTGNVHNAGRPFQIDATAQNGAGTPATTTNYSVVGGQPIVVLTQCGVAAVCPATFGTLTPGTFSAASGVITTTTATYNDVGAFNLVLEDRTFTQVDSTDPGFPVPATHYFSSAAVTVGRFVPDYFTLDAGSTITPRSDIGACSGSSFTYMSERMDLVFTLSAREFAGGAVTPNYSGATLGALVLNSSGSYGFGAIDTAAPTLLTARLDLSLIPAVSATWSAGSASITAPLAVQRAATPDGPFASLKLGIAPSDPDTVTLRTADLNLDADNSGSPERAQVGGTTAVRFGRLRLQNASGSEKIDLVIPLQAQYWSGTGFETNTADSCTSLSAANLSLGSYAGGITAANMDTPPGSHISVGGAFASGVGSLKLTKPSPTPASPGSTTLTIDLAAETKTYLQGNWGVPTFTANPSARAGFGLYGAQPRQFIFFRENY